MTVLVTGGNGFLGRPLVRALLQGGHRVRVLTRRVEAGVHPRGVEQLCGDITDPASLPPALADVETVYHAAAVVPARGGGARLWDTNVDGTRHVAEACVQAGVRRLVLVSSVGVYRAPLPARVPESAPSGGTDLYGRSKTEAEAVARAVCRGRVELVVARPCQIYGPMDASGYTRRLLRLVGGTLVPVAGWSGRGFSLVHVDDVVDALCLAGLAQDLGGAVFNIASDAPVTLPQLAEVHATVLARKRLSVRLPIPASALRGALTLRWMAGNVRHGGLAEIKSYAPGHTHGSLLLGGPLYDTTAARQLLGFRACRTPEQVWPELLEAEAAEREAG
ncbi:NAD-dependent epimerase/dehydratase family protein [Caldimonas brevitalea]|uniref:Dihydroflavonol-4-reductase n=1 Tax=Caldimonas brevitalea TaxID=413882 RepID=A0A0G3BV33_9BURK|nr:NAD(P)-dependent oxidoreductase [Caldimonas brevitalea]AKJ31873.1 dihydroflavonol-4-reductase [Caldimonas brevitalea]